ncbi:hypothetical protein KAI92_05390 [Candidatus Parcubacteria bacterium]|nr:hypothetical protein [Candidatus Parcubacteria bacterium]
MENWKESDIALFLSWLFGNKRIVTVVCEQCKTRNWERVAENVCCGSITFCKKCDDLIYFPAPDSSISKKAQKNLLKK